MISSSQNPNEYWKNLKGNCNKRSNHETKINEDIWFNYSKALQDL